MGKARWDFEATKWKTSTVYSMVNSEDIPDLQLLITPWRAQTTRSTPAKQRGEVGEGQQMFWNVPHVFISPTDKVRFSFLYVFNCRVCLAPVSLIYIGSLDI